MGGGDRSLEIPGIYEFAADNNLAKQPGVKITDQLAVGPALAAAEATSTLRLGALVFGNDYRHPVLLAKEMATLDVLSEGRMELGLGAGWMRTDYEAAGMS